MLFPPADASGVEQPMDGALDARWSSPASAIGAAKAWRWSKRIAEGELDMASHHDKRRPADRRRHRHGRRHLARRRQGRQLGQAHRRPIRHPRPSPASPPTGSRPASPARSISCRSNRSRAPALTETARRPRGRGSDRAVRHRRARRFPGPAVPRRAADRDRMAAAPRGRGGIAAPTTPSATTTCCAPPQRAVHAIPRALPVRLGRRPSGRPVRHQGLADLAVDRLRLRRDRDPARRRGDPPRRNRRRALHRHRRLGQSGIADPLLAALGALDLERRSAAAGAPSPSPRTATASSWRKAPARWCWKAWRPRRRAARRSSACIEGCGEMADAFHRTRSSPDGKPIIGCIRNALADAGLDARRHRLHQRARHRHARERQDGSARRHRRVRRARQDASRSRPTSR